MNDNTYLTTEKKLVCPVVKDIEYSVRARTGKLRFSPTDIWKEIRFLLSEKQVDPFCCVLAQFYQDSPSAFRGVLILADQSVVEFLFSYKEDDILKGTISSWKNLHISDREFISWNSEIQVGITLI